MKYPIVIHKEPGSSYGVAVPDLPGCFSGGETLDEAMSAACEAIECHVEGIMMDRDPIPERKPMEIHVANPDFAGGIWAVVSVDISRLCGKLTQFQVEMPNGVINAIDEAAGREHESRDGFLTRAALHYILHLQDTEGIEPIAATSR